MPMLNPFDMGARKRLQSARATIVNHQCVYRVVNHQIRLAEAIRNRVASQISSSEMKKVANDIFCDLVEHREDIGLLIKKEEELIQTMTQLYLQQESESRARVAQDLPPRIESWKDESPVSFWAFDECRDLFTTKIQCVDLLLDEMERLLRLLSLPLCHHKDGSEV